MARHGRNNMKAKSQLDRRRLENRSQKGCTQYFNPKNRTAGFRADRSSRIRH